jgi:hypothetical protein
LPDIYLSQSKKVYKIIWQSENDVVSL